MSRYRDPLFQVSENDLHLFNLRSNKHFQILMDKHSFHMPEGYIQNLRSKRRLAPIFPQNGTILNRSTLELRVLTLLNTHAKYL